MNREWIRDRHQLSGGVERLRKVAGQLLGSGHCGRQSLGQALPEPLEVYKEECLVAALIHFGQPDRTAHRKTVLVEREGRPFLAGAVEKEVVGIQLVVTQE